MLNIALEMKDVNYVNYLCFCLENNLIPSNVKSLDKFRSEVDKKC